jgi:GT2 family glycosyltransferase
MLSVITAVYNQLEVNKLYLDSLRRYTRLPYELIIIDNASTDGSAELFRSAGARVITNDGNYSYPRCQNQGLAVAKHDLLAFLNNDLVVAPDWDARMLEAMDRQGLEAATCCGVERAESRGATRWYRKKWSLVRNTVRFFRGDQERALRLMHRLMYGNWETFARKRWARFGCTLREGFVGNTVLMKRSAIEKLGAWDERINAADFDLYLRSKVRSMEKGDVKPLHVALGVFNHHFIRMTFRGPRPAYKDQANLMRLDEKWGAAKVKEFLALRG